MLQVQGPDHENTVKDYWEVQKVSQVISENIDLQDFFLQVYSKYIFKMLLALLIITMTIAADT